MPYNRNTAKSSVSIERCEHTKTHLPNYYFLIRSEWTCMYEHMLLQWATNQLW